MIYLDVEDLLVLAKRVIGDSVVVRDLGLLDTAAHRPQSTVFGADAYPDIASKAAAMVESLVGNHALLHDNKRFGLAAAVVFLSVNGCRLTMTNDDAYEWIMDVAAGRLRDVVDIAVPLRTHIESVVQ